jgi:hypothetical protein
MNVTEHVIGYRKLVIDEAKLVCDVKLAGYAITMYSSKHLVVTTLGRSVF